tara:strand:+ start:61 stop:663 length:603 start_codon:yes stop_codon:yes gene_type:complete
MDSFNLSVLELALLQVPTGAGNSGRWSDAIERASLYEGRILKARAGVSRARRNASKISRRMSQGETVSPFEVQKMENSIRYAIRTMSEIGAHRDAEVADEVTDMTESLKDVKEVQERLKKYVITQDLLLRERIARLQLREEKASQMKTDQEASLLLHKELLQEQARKRPQALFMTPPTIRGASSIPNQNAAARGVRKTDY